MLLLKCVPLTFSSFFGGRFLVYNNKIIITAYVHVFVEKIKMNMAKKYYAKYIANFLSTEFRTHKAVS